MQRLAALVPRPRLRLIRFHGFLAPNAKLRPLVVPQGPAQTEQSSEPTAPAECEIETAQARPGRISLGSAALAGVRHGHAALPQLPRRGTKDLRGHPGAAGHREDPDSPGPGCAATTPRAGVRGGARFCRLSHALNHAGCHKRRAPGLQRKTAARAAMHDASARHHLRQGQPEDLTASAPGERSKDLLTPLEGRQHRRLIQALLAASRPSWSLPRAFEYPTAAMMLTCRDAAGRERPSMAESRWPRTSASWTCNARRSGWAVGQLSAMPNGSSGS